MLQGHINHTFYIGAQAFGSSKYGSAGIPIDQTNYACTGSEDTLASCSSADSTNNCGTDQVAGVKCASRGQCEAAGHTECCISDCNAGGCYCDTACHGFGDCCDDIANTCPQGTPVSGIYHITFFDNKLS